MKNLNLRLIVFIQLSEFYVNANRRPKNVDMHTMEDHLFKMACSVARNVLLENRFSSWEKEKYCWVRRALHGGVGRRGMETKGDAQHISAEEQQFTLSGYYQHRLSD